MNLFDDVHSYRLSLYPLFRVMKILVSEESIHAMTIYTYIYLNFKEIRYWHLLEIYGLNKLKYQAINWGPKRM